MGTLSKFNYYSFQDLNFSVPIILSMLEKNCRLKRIFNFLRKDTRWDSIGDYPIIAFICSFSKNIGFKFEVKEIMKVFHQTGEFKNIQQNNEIIKQICV